MHIGKPGNVRSIGGEALIMSVRGFPPREMFVIETGHGGKERNWKRVVYLTPWLEPEFVSATALAIPISR